MESPFPLPEALIPHRPPQLLVTRILACAGDTLVAEHDVGPGDLPGHFPDQPVVPGVWMIEGLAQALACLGRLQGGEGRAVLAGVQNARFRRPVLPPACLRYEVEITERRFGLIFAKGTVRVEGKAVASAELSVMLA